jgi:predicted secreted hydrolase
LDPNSIVAALDPDTRDSIAQALWLRELRADALPSDVLGRLISPKNQNAAFAERLRYRLTYMLEHPDSFTPSYRKRYETLLAHAGSLSPHRAYAMTSLLGLDSSKGYRRIPDRADLRFPAAHAEDLQTQVGWYFFVGSCWDEDGAEYGVELMFWRVALLPVPVARAFGLTDIENQIVELQLAVSKAGDRHYQAKPIVVAGTTGLLEYKPDGLGARLGKNVVRSLEPDGVFPIQIQAKGWCDAEEEPVELEIDLTFASSKGVILQGANGCMPCCGGVGTLYYSIPNLRLDPERSRLRLKGREARLTRGKFWMDHQWGTGMVPGGSPRNHVLRALGALNSPGPGGWDWFNAQFDDDQEVTFSALHSRAYLPFYHQTGATPPGTMTVEVRGKHSLPDGTVRDVGGTMQITDWVKVADSPDPAQYRSTHTWYPNRWEFTLDDVPDAIRRFTMTPIVARGQAGFFANGAQYAEGAVYLTNERGERIGRGFAESVLYADTERNVLALAGLPDTEEMAALFRPATAPPWLKAAGILYTALPQNRKEAKRLLECCGENGLALMPQLADKGQRA